MWEKEFSPSEQTPEMQIAEQLRPLKSSAYQKQAKDLMHKYHLNVELPVSVGKINITLKDTHQQLWFPDGC